MNLPATAATATATTPSTDWVTPGAMLRHYKGGLYRVTGLCRIEATGEAGVLYQPLQGDTGTTWMRPRAQFDDQVETPAGAVQRFALVPPAAGPADLNAR